MAIIKCKECGEPISTQALVCPKCGAPRAKRTSGCALVAAAFAGVILIVFAGELVTEKPALPATASRPGANAQSSKGGAPAVAPSSPAHTSPYWAYAAEPSKMVTGGVDRMGLMVSTNVVDFGAPYEGEQRGGLVVRARAGRPIDVAIQIDRGQLLCRPVSGCGVSVKFDDQPAKEFPASEPGDLSTTILFIRREKDFVAQLGRAKVVRIQVTVYQEGNQVFEFPVAGFSMEKLQNTKP